MTPPPRAATEATIAKMPRQGAFMPKEGGYLTIQLPGEITRAKVVKIVSADSVIVELESVPMAKSHSFKLGDKVGVRRRTKLNGDVWEGQTDREFLNEQRQLMATKPEASKGKAIAPKGKKGRAA